MKAKSKIKRSPAPLDHAARREQVRRQIRLVLREKRRLEGRRS